ncbi:histidine phosphatase family protein [Amorphus sp. 3PC139-8]|uniref:SixA phosphatase family protein n=1 Tax=Amorphus sp. 3PC139-8 TaxID=2735676 RepID=UPI00345CEAF6
MRRLMLLRHAKSSWDDPELSDFDRPLNKRGRKAAPAMAREMAARGLVPDLVLCSNAQRTRETLAALLQHLAGPFTIRLSEELYEAGANRIVDVIRTHGGNAKAVLVIGHNPGLQDCAAALADPADGGNAAAVGGGFPTGALVVLDFDIPAWTDVTTDSGRVAAFLRPKDLSNKG